MQALDPMPVSGITVAEVRGYGRQKGKKEMYRGAEYEVRLVPKIRLDIACRDSDVEAVIAAITDGAKTESIGDGKIFVTDLEQAVRVRTGERGDNAIE